MTDVDRTRLLSTEMNAQIGRAWRAFKSGQASEVDLILLWLEAAAQAEGTDLHAGWTISPCELLSEVEAALGECADEQELERRGLGWLRGALEGPIRRNLIRDEGEAVAVADDVDVALRSAKTRVGTGPFHRRFRPVG